MIRHLITALVLVLEPLLGTSSRQNPLGLPETLRATFTYVHTLPVTSLGHLHFEDCISKTARCKAKNIQVLGCPCGSHFSEARRLCHHFMSASQHEVSHSGPGPGGLKVTQTCSSPTWLHPGSLCGARSRALSSTYFSTW
jgi:hypothetical protein